MVSSLSIAFMVVSLFISGFLPLLFAVMTYRRLHYWPGAVGVGVTMMTLSQFVIRIPLLRALSNEAWYRSMAGNVFLIAIFLGLTAGIFEEVARYAGFRLFFGNRFEWKNGIAYGIGHGGIEAALLVGTTYINNLILSFAINSGTFDTKIAASLPPAVAASIKASLMHTPPATFLLGGIERLLTLIIQVALSMVVLYGVANKKNIYLVYAIVLHMLIDSPIVILSAYIKNPWILETWVLAWALLSVAYIRWSRAAWAPECSAEERTETSAD